MKRRKLLTSASALAGAALTGCGGGDENGTLDGDPSSQIAAYVLPATLVPKNAQWHVEVSFFTQNRCEVSLELGPANALFEKNLVASKAYTSESSHRLNFSVMRCNGDTTYTNFNWARLSVKEYTPSGLVLTAQHGGGVTNTSCFQHTVWNDWERPEYEYKCYSRDNLKLLCRVRFFQLVGDEAYAFPAGQYIVPITPTSTHANIFGTTRAYPVQHATNLRMVDHEVAVIQAANNKDTICIPNPRATGHYELVPSYLAASDAEKPFIRHRMGRHIDRFSKATRASYVMDTPDDDEVHHLLGNEIVRILGGKTLIDHYNNVRDKATASIMNNLDQMGSAFYEFCKSNLPALSSQEMDDQNRALLATTVKDHYNYNSRISGGGVVSTNLQFYFGFTEKDYPWPGFDAGLGGRLSIGLARAGIKWDRGVPSALHTYKIGDMDSEGLKLGFTLVVKGMAGSSCLIGKESMDLEINANFTLKGGVMRLDSLSFDPVYDIDTRTWVGQQVVHGLARLLSPVIGGLQAIEALPQELAYSPPAFMSTLGYKMANVASKLEASSAQLINARIKSYLNPLLKVVSTFTGVGGRTYGTFESSGLRIVNVNADVNDPTIPFSRHVTNGGFGWMPGAKYIAGFGFAKNYYFPPLLPGTTIVPPDTLTYGGFMRVVTVMELYGVYGNAQFMQANGYRWAH